MSVEEYLIGLGASRIWLKYQWALADREMTTAARKGNLTECLAKMKERDGYAESLKAVERNYKLYSEGR